MPKFDYPAGSLNDIQIESIRRSFDPNQTSLWGSIGQAINELFTPDITKNTGPYKAVILRVEDINAEDPPAEGFLNFLKDMVGLGADGDATTTGALKKMVAIKARIPELHGHLPIPTEVGDPQGQSYPDHYKIDAYPTFTAQSDRQEFSKVKPGDVVVVDYVDKKNFLEPIFVTPIAVQQFMPVPGAHGPGSGLFNPNCPPFAGTKLAGNGLADAALTNLHTGLSAANTRARNSGAKAVLFGDSQCAGNLGAALEEYITKSLGYIMIKPASWAKKNNKRMGQSGASMSSWLLDGRGSLAEIGAGKFGYLEDALSKEVDLVVAVGSANGGYDNDTPAKLVKRIRNRAPNASIVWIGPPPAVMVTRKTGAGWSLEHLAANHWLVKKRRNGMLYADWRQAVNSKIRASVSSLPGVTFVNPKDLVPRYISSPGKSCDGIHMSLEGSIEFINNLKKTASPAPGGKNMEELNAQIKVAEDKVAAALSKAKEGLSNLLSPISKQVQDMAKIAYESFITTYENSEIATEFLKERAALLYDTGYVPYALPGEPQPESTGTDKEQGINAIFVSFLVRDWVSGFLLEDGHISAMTVDESLWMPGRAEEMQVWGNFSSIPHTTLDPERDPYGPETLNLIPQLYGVALGPGPPADASFVDDNPFPPGQEGVDILKQVSYEMAAAVYMQKYGTAQPTPDTTSPSSAPTTPKPYCPPAGTGAYAGLGGVGGGPIELPADGVVYFIPSIEDAINKAATAVSPLIGMDYLELKTYLRMSCKIESNGTFNSTNWGGYSGLFAIGAYVWAEYSQKTTGKLYQQATNEVMGPYIRDYNYAYDPYKQAMVVACATLGKINALKRAGIPPTLQHLYMCHNQGLAGFKNIYKRAKAGTGWGQTSWTPKIKDVNSSNPKATITLSLSLTSPGGSIPPKPGWSDWNNAWSNAAGNKRLGGTRLRELFHGNYYANPQAQRPWEIVTPKVFYDIWARITRNQISNVGKTQATPVGGWSTRAKYRYKMSGAPPHEENGNKGGSGWGRTSGYRAKEDPLDSPGGPNGGGPALMGYWNPGGPPDNPIFPKKKR